MGCAASRPSASADEDPTKPKPPRRSGTLTESIAAEIEEREALGRMFMELDTDGDGFVTSAEIRAALEKVGYEMDDNELTL